MQKRLHYSVDLIVPCFNEQEALPITAPVMLSYMRALLAQPDLHLQAFRILLVCDGADDSTWSIIAGLAHKNPEITGIKLSRNFGHQNALLAGLSLSRADASISMDADLQDDINVIERMLRAFEAGSDLALGVRSDRSSDTGFKRTTAQLYYRILAILGVEVIHNHADFRLMSRRALDVLMKHKEVNLFLRGIIPTLGFTATTIPYSRQPRTAGETKYSLRKMISLGINGVTSFSVVPLRIIAALGSILFALAIAAAVVVLGMRLFASAYVIPGWTSTVLPILVLSGVQLLSLGIIGEYIGKIYMEVKGRPRFIVESIETQDRN